LASLLAVLVQDPDSGLIDYGDTTVRHAQQEAVVLTFLDFYRQGPSGDDLKYLVFDSKFTTYQNLAKLDEQGIKFLTIRRRGKQIVSSLNALPAAQWKKRHVTCAGQRTRLVYVHESQVLLKGYGKEIRQVALKARGKLQPALIITNDTDTKAEEIIRKYARRWLVEKSISEQIEFFHFNRVSSSMVIKVDFDFTMTILAHNLYRLFAQDLERYRQFSDTRIFEKFIQNSGEILIEKDNIRIRLKKKKQLPLLLSTMEKFSSQRYSWVGKRTVLFEGMASS
jgi:hypothetical protein